MTGHEHAGDRLSALLDGELSVADADQVEAHVRECPACARELAEVREARELLRALPPVDAPSWLATIGEPQPLSRLLRPLPATVSVAATVLVVLLLLGSFEPSSTSPALGQVRDQHASTVAALGVARSDGGITATTAATMDVGSFSAPLRRPPEALGDYRLVDAFVAADGGVQLVYRAGSLGLSVFQAPGTIDWDALPADQGHRVSIVGRDGWRWDDPPSAGRVVVYEDDGMVVTVVADAPGDVALEMAALVPSSRDLSVVQRIERGLTRAVKVLSPG